MGSLMDLLLLYLPLLFLMQALQPFFVEELVLDVLIVFGLELSNLGIELGEFS